MLESAACFGELGHVVKINNFSRRCFTLHLFKSELPDFCDFKNLREIIGKTN